MLPLITPPLLCPSYTHIHTNTHKQASLWQVAQLVGVCLWRSTDAHGDAFLSVKEVSSIAGTLRHPWLINIHRSSRKLLWTEGRKKINQIMKQCSAKRTRNVLLGVLLVICHLTTAYAQADSQVTMCVHLLLIPPQTLVVIAAKLFSRLPSSHDSICSSCFFFPTRILNPNRHLKMQKKKKRWPTPTRGIDM